MTQLLNRRVARRVTLYPGRWRGHTSADDEWLLLKGLAHCREKVVEYDATALCRRAARRALPDAAPAPAPAAPRASPARVDTTCGARRVSAGGSVRGRSRPGPRRPAGAVLLAGYRWVRGTAARRSRATGFSHQDVVRSALLWLMVRS